MSKSILIIDDSASIRQMLGFTLRAAGDEVEEAVDGRDGLGKAQRKAKDIACINNLRLIDEATQQWARNNKWKPEANVAWNDITPYLKLKLTCPLGGNYTIGPTGSNAPTCSITGHVLPP